MRRKTVNASGGQSVAERKKPVRDKRTALALVRSNDSQSPTTLDSAAVAQVRRGNGPYRLYTDEDRASALALLDANGGNQLKTARQLGIPRMTLNQWANGKVNRAVTILRHEKRQDLADIAEEIARQGFAAMPDKIGDARLGEVNAMVGTAIDKMLLLREQPAPEGANVEMGPQTLAAVQAIAKRFPKRTEELAKYFGIDPKSLTVDREDAKSAG